MIQNGAELVQFSGDGHVDKNVTCSLSSLMRSIMFASSFLTLFYRL